MTKRTAKAPVKDEKKVKEIKKAPKVVKAVKGKPTKTAPKASKAPVAKLSKASSLKLEKEAAKHHPQPRLNGGKSLELCLLLDCTGSMASWI